MLIKDIPVSFSGPSDWRDEVTKRKKDISSGIAFCIHHKKTGYETFQQQPCHGRLSGKTGVTFVATAINNCHSPSDVKKKHSTFIDWWVNRSYASPFILNPSTCQEDGFTAVTGDLWFPFMNCLNIVNRSFCEKPWEASAWADLVEKGVPEEVAFVVAFSTTYGSITANLDVAKGYFQTSHVPIQNMGVSGLKNFFLQDATRYVDGKTGWFSEKNGNYSGGIQTFGECRDYGWMKEIYSDVTFRRMIDEYRGVNTKENSFKNPFLRQGGNLSEHLYTKKEFDDVVIPYLISIYEGVSK